jgi:hypothetical protein
MYQLNLKKLSLIILFTFVSINSCLAAGTKKDPNSFYKAGDYRDIEILTPKQGFKGSPPSSSPMPDFRIPKTEDDYNKKYVRITILEIKGIKGSTRIGFSLDEIDPNGKYVMYPAISRSDPDYHKPIYYGVLFIKPNDYRMEQIRSIIISALNYPELDPDQVVGSIGSPNGFNVHGIQFPLTFTFPPKLNPHKNMKDNSFMAISGNGVAYDEPNMQSATRQTIIKATYFEQESDSDYKDKHKDKIAYFSNNSKTLDKDKQTDSTEVMVKAHEKQIWSDDNDWLWKEMERTDADGNVTMRCERQK